MKQAAKKLEFERAAQIRDEIRELSRMETEIGLWG
jgi:protein-arginine kinase activator protein McsA